MKINPSEIYPTQNFLKPGTVEYIFDCISNGHKEDLPPAPIVRKDAEGNLLAIDGHNLIAVLHYLGEEIEVHLAESTSDGLGVKTNKDATRNQELHDKYDQILELRQQTISNGVNTFQDLIDQNKELFDVE